MQRQGGLDTLDRELGQRPTHAGYRLRPCGRVDNQLTNHAVVKGRHDIPGIKRAIDPHAQAARRVEQIDPARCGHERLRILRRDPTLDRVPVERHIGLRVAQRLPSGDADLLPHQIDAAHHFCHRMLDLQPGVHLDKGELPVLVKKLQRTSIAVA